MATLEMTRGDYRELPVLIPLSAYEVGAKLFFTVKAEYDDATDDSAAVFSVDMDDTDIASMAYTPEGSTTVYVKYNCVITSDATQTYAMTSTKVKLIAEFQYVAPGVKPTTWPAMTLVLYRDATRRRA
jgi:hypothetical protein